MDCCVFCALNCHRDHFLKFMGALKTHCTCGEFEHINCLESMQKIAQLWPNHKISIIFSITLTCIKTINICYFWNWRNLLLNNFEFCYNNNLTWKIYIPPKHLLILKFLEKFPHKSSLYSSLPQSTTLVVCSFSHSIIPSFVLSASKSTGLAFPSDG